MKFREEELRTRRMKEIMGVGESSVVYGKLTEKKTDVNRRGY